MKLTAQEAQLLNDFRLVDDLMKRLVTNLCAQDAADERARMAAVRRTNLRLVAVNGRRRK
jgi:hypothetical protein